MRCTLPRPQKKVPAGDLWFKMLLGSPARINFPLSPVLCLVYLAIDLIKYVSRLQGSATAQTETPDSKITAWN